LTIVENKIKKNRTWLFGLHADPPKIFRFILAILPFVILIVVYLIASNIRHTNNPHDKLLPTISKMGKTLKKVAVTKDKRTGQYLLWNDTISSLKRIITGVSLAAFTGFILGLNMGLFPGVRCLLLLFITFIANIPPLAILPILFISFGVDEAGKIMLIFLGTFPLITRDIYLAVKKIPREMIVKALTLGASQQGVLYRIVYPQVAPRLIETIRLSLGGAWLFLIAGEAIAAQNGLGYRIFLVRRYLAMDVIILYVIWITLMAVSVDFMLKKWVAVRYPWYNQKNEN